MSLKQLLSEIAGGWVNAKREQFAGNALARLLREDLVREVAKHLSNPDNYSIKASAGAGNWADVAWLSILNPAITNSTQSGVYPVYLFCSDGSGVYLSLGFGTTELKRQYGTALARQKAEELRKSIRELDNRLDAWDQKVDLRSNTTLGKSYEWASAGAKFYPLENLPSEDVLTSDLKEILEIYADINLETNQNPKPAVRNAQALSKSFLLLAGISGTGKTRFVRQQAERTAVTGTSNFELIPVRPDWHEPSDLLGYVSRIDGTRYVATPFLQFMAAAWRDAAEPGAAYQLKDPAYMTPFWACLDEMNLAPVEQYFADYLSVLETREWRDGKYSSEPIFAPGKLLKSADAAVIEQLCIDLGFADEEWAGLWDNFIAHGMPLPPNLIVAGTVNMDETTHGFSRKVIDRAFTIDFGEFFPNVYDDFFAPKLEPVTLGFPLDSQIANADELADVAADRNGQVSIEFLKAVNELLKGTPFELAFRALNELLVMLKCFSPQTEPQLYAVWDDFLMAKLLPRLEGDEDKLQANGDNSLLVELRNLLMSKGLKPEQTRPDLFNIQLADGKSPEIPFRSLKKLSWMQDRLVRDRFTSFWP